MDIFKKLEFCMLNSCLIELILDSRRIKRLKYRIDTSINVSSTCIIESPINTRSSSHIFTIGRKEILRESEKRRPRREPAVRFCNSSIRFGRRGDFFFYLSLEKKRLRESREPTTEPVVGRRRSMSSPTFINVRRDGYYPRGPSKI